MKKILSIFVIISLSILPSRINAGNSVIVSAIVGSLNQAPFIISVNPEGDPWILGTNEVQNYSIYFKDNEKDTIYYTITPGLNSGFVNKVSGIINKRNYDTASGAYINFLYLSPASSNPNAYVTVTLNDGPNVTFKQLNLYVY